MPITDREFERGEYVEDEEIDAVEATGEHETEKDLVVAFLGENVGYAFTKPEIARGADFGDHEDPETILETLKSLPAELVDLAGEATASTFVADDIDEAVADLVAEGIVERSEIEEDGETVEYYRIST